MLTTLDDLYAECFKLSEPCIVYEGLVETNKHPRIYVSGKNQSLHILAWRLANPANDIPPGYELHHICFNKRCINVKHLLLLTHTEHYNIHQFKKKIRFSHGPKADAMLAMSNMLKACTTPIE